MRLLQTENHDSELSYTLSTHSEGYSSGSLRNVKKIAVADSDTVLRIKSLLSALTRRIEAKGAAFYTTSTTTDSPTAHVGNISHAKKLSQLDKQQLYSGQTIKHPNYYIQPIRSERHTIGYLAIDISAEQCTDFVENVSETYAELIFHELELSKKKSTLEKFSDKLTMKKKELEKAQEYNNNLLSMTSHDLSSPLNAVSGYLELMNDCLKENPKVDRIEGYHQRIQSGVNEIMEMIRQLSDINKLERGEITPNIVEVNLCWLVTEVCELMESKAIEKEIEFSLELSPQPVYVKADSVKLKRVIQNLISNAIKYTPEKGRVQVSINETDHEALLQVKDNGVGIAESHYSKIFNPFIKLDKTDDHFSSCGLGLYIASYFTELMNGDISLQSKENEGSTFTIALPRAESMMIQNRQAG